MKLKMLNFNKLIPLLSFILLINFAYAQRNVTGKVTGNDGGVVPGASVVVKGTTVGTMTDFDGNYSISVPDDATVLVFSFIGMKTQEINITGNIVNCVLEYDDSELAEVVVIGYGEVKKEDLTGSISTVSTEDFNQGAITTPQELMMGKVSGVVITAPSGAPGGNSTVRIRGGSSLRANNDPLYVIDGIPIDNTDIGGMANPLSTINPNDIETFTVLKDASATAIYGSRASNGVIIITTKKGKPGKFRATYNGNISIGVPVKFLEVLDGDEFRILIQDRVDNYGLTDAALDGLGTVNTDWHKEIYQNALSHDHNVSFNATSFTVPYRVSLGYTDQSGILKYSNMKRSTVDLSLNPMLFNNTLKVDLNGKFAFTKNNFSNSDAIGSAVEFDPTQPIKNGNTRYGGYTAWVGSNETDSINGLPNNIATHNPMARLEYRDDQSEAQRYFGNAQFEYNPPFISGLKLILKGAYDYYNSVGDNNTDSLASWSYREPDLNLQHYENKRTNSLLDFYLNYKKEIGETHSIDFTGGYSWQHFYYEGVNSHQDYNAIDSVIEANTIPYKREYYLISFFGRLNYTLLNKYLLTATLRDDGSSRFSEENRWGLFPSVALAWKIKEESFLKAVNTVSNLKLRIGWGMTGQQDIADNFYPYIPTYRTSTAGAFYEFGGNFYPTLRPNPYDANIKWEETTTQNIALDFGFLNERISGTVDFYKRITDDLINTVPIAAGTNFSNFLTTNVGSLENRGFEASLTLRPIAKKDLVWEIPTNFSYNQNEITKLTLVEDSTYVGYETGGISGGVGNNVQINAVGYPTFTFLLFQQVYNADGTPIEGLYVDKTGEGGVVSANDLNKYYLGNPAPEYTIGLSSRVEYKQFDLAFSARVNIGNDVYNNNASSKALYQNLYNQSGYTANVLKSVYESNFTYEQYWSDFYLEDGTFFRMDNITLGYNFNKLVSDKLRGRMSFTVQNAFVITDYTGIDPEVFGGIDNNLFQRPRTFMFGLNLNY